MSNWAVGPVVLPLFTAIILLFASGKVRVQRTIAATFTLANFALGMFLLRKVALDGILTVQMGDWPAPFGISLVVDRLSAIMLTAGSVVAMAALMFSIFSLDAGRKRFFYYPLFALLMMGVNGSFVTGDIFNLFVFFEILLISSYILLTLGGESFQLQEGFKYMVLNMLASALFLFAVAVTYSTLGTVNMADLAVKVSSAQAGRGWITTIAVLWMIVFGMKAAIFPLYFWLPRSYFAPPTAIVALFSGLLTKVGVYALIRVFTLIFTQDSAYTNQIFIVVGGATMLLGVLGALAQYDIKLILAVHIISQIGYMIMGLGIYTPLAVAGAIFFAVHNMVVKSCLFLTGGVVEKVAGTSHLKRISGVLTTHPGLAALFALASLSLAGVPPLSGFFGKFVLIKAGFVSHHYGIIALSIVVSVLTLFSMIKIFRLGYWGDVKVQGQPEAVGAAYGRMLIPIGFLVAVSVVMGIAVEPIFGYMLKAGTNLLNPDLYITAVLGPR